MEVYILSTVLACSLSGILGWKIGFKEGKEAGEIKESLERAKQNLRDIKKMAESLRGHK